MTNAQIWTVIILGFALLLFFISEWGNRGRCNARVTEVEQDTPS